MNNIEQVLLDQLGQVAFVNDGSYIHETNFEDIFTPEGEFRYQLKVGTFEA